MKTFYSFFVCGMLCGLKVESHKNDSIHKSVYGSMRELTTFRNSLAKHVLNQNKTPVFSSDPVPVRGFKTQLFNNNNLMNPPPVNKTVQFASKRNDDKNIKGDNDKRETNIKVKKSAKISHSTLKKSEEKHHRNMGKAKYSGMRRLDTESAEPRKDRCAPDASAERDDEFDEEEEKEDKEEKERKDEHNNEEQDDEEEEEEEGTHKHGDKCHDEDDDDDSEYDDEDYETGRNSSPESDDSRFNEIANDPVFKTFSASFDKEAQSNWERAASVARSHKQPTSYARFTKYVVNDSKANIT